MSVAYLCVFVTHSLFTFFRGNRLGVEDRLSDCFYVIHGTYQKELQSPHEFSDITTLRTLPAGEQDDLREVRNFHLCAVRLVYAQCGAHGKNFGLLALHCNADV
jgi:hypothetical protein